MILHRDSRCSLLPKFAGGRRSSIALACRNRRRPDLEALERRTLLTAGTLDTSFGGTGQVITNLGTWTEPQGLAVQSDLKTVVVGLEQVSNSSLPSLTLFRYNVDGSLDTTFGSGGEVVLATNSIVQTYSQHSAAVALQPDGKIVVATSTATGKQREHPHVLRYAGPPVQRERDRRHILRSERRDRHPSCRRGWSPPTAVTVLPSGQIVVAGTNPDAYGSYIGP